MERYGMLILIALLIVLPLVGSQHAVNTAAAAILWIGP
jgi:hypothetical protein